METRTNQDLITWGEPYVEVLRKRPLPKKSHTCEKGGAHLKISFWHLLMNLKIKYLLKKLLKLANKKQNSFNIVAFVIKNKEKHQEISLFYTSVPEIN